MAVSAVRVKGTHKQSTVLEIVLREGKNREIRRILAALGHKVHRLKRVALGPLKLGKLPQGSVRPLERSELAALKRLATDETEKPRTPRQRKTSKGSKLQRGSRDSKFAGRSKKSKPPTGRKKTAKRSKR